MYCFEQKQRIAIEQRLDKNEYDEAALFEIKVSLSIPYLNDWVDFERVDGELEHQGIHYKYVKRKIENGFLIVKCIPNESKARLVNAKDAFFKLVNDLPGKVPVKKSAGDNHSAKTFSFEYCQKTDIWNFANHPLNLSFNNFNHTGSLLSAVISSPEQPPEQMSADS
ncbi:MAG: hypothetical protein QM725_14730 [Lacibacter sp.]